MKTSMSNHTAKAPVPAFVSSFSPSPRVLLRASSFTSSLVSRTKYINTSSKSARVTNMSTIATPATTNSDIKRLPSGATVHNKVVYLPPVTSANGDTASQTAGILSEIESHLSSTNSDKSRILTVSAVLSPSASLDDFNKSISSWLSSDQGTAPISISSSTFLPSDTLLSIQVTAGTVPPPSIIKTMDAAQAVGPYNQAIGTQDGTLYVSGCIGLTADTGVMAGDTVTSQTVQALSNLRAILKAAGCSPNDVVKTIVLLDNMGDFATVNEMYAEFFAGGRVPARSCFAAKTLPKGALVEIEAVANIPQ